MNRQMKKKKKFYYSDDEVMKGETIGNPKMYSTLKNTWKCKCEYINFNHSNICQRCNCKRLSLNKKIKRNNYKFDPISTRKSNSFVKSRNRQILNSIGFIAKQMTNIYEKGQYYLSRDIRSSQVYFGNLTNSLMTLKERMKNVMYELETHKNFISLKYNDDPTQPLTYFKNEINMKKEKKINEKIMKIKKKIAKEPTKRFKDDINYNRKVNINPLHTFNDFAIASKKKKKIQLKKKN